jgi:hypothetical protein
MRISRSAGVVTVALWIDGALGLVCGPRIRATLAREMDSTRERLWRQHVERDPLPGPVEVVRWLVASQAQDYLNAKWAIGIRAAGATDATVERAYDDGHILRTHVLRPTWHFVLPEDIGWLLALTGPRVHAANASRGRQLGLDTATRIRAADAFARALEGSVFLTRDELRDVLSRVGISTEGQRMAYLLMYAELEAVVCSGPRRGKQFTYALLDERAPDRRTLSRDEALAELGARYLASRSPATPQDLAKWSGLTVADARRAIDGVAVPAPGRLRATPAAHLLSIYDEFLSSYRTGESLEEPEDAMHLVGQGNALSAVVVVNGKIAGTWKRTFGTRAVHVTLAPFRPWSSETERVVSEAAHRYAAFLGPDVELELTRA